MAKITVEYYRELSFKESLGEITEQNLVELLNDKASEPDTDSLKAYAIKDPKGKIISSSIGVFEETCKERFINKYNFEEFKQCEDRGYRCVPVEIREIKTK